MSARVDLSMRLFDVTEINGVYTPVYCPVLMNIPCFKKLYLEDTTEDKAEYAKQLAYMWFYIYPGSPYKNSENRKEESLLAAFGDVDYPISDTLEECVQYYEKHNVTPEARYERTVLEMINDLSVRRTQIVKEISLTEGYIEGLMKHISTTQEVNHQAQLFKYIDERKKSINDRKKEEVEIMSKLNDIVKQLPEIRKRAEEAQNSLQENSNTVIESSFMMSFLEDYDIKGV